MFEEGQFKSPFECGSKFADIQLIFITLLHVIRDDTVCTFKVEITGGAMLFMLVVSKQTLPSALFKRNISQDS